MDPHDKKVDSPRLEIYIYDVHKAANPETEDPSPDNWFFDTSISKFRPINIEIETPTFNYSRRRDGFPLEYGVRILEFVKKLYRALTGIRAIAWAYYNYDRYGDILFREWDTNADILKICNRDMAFNLCTWYAIVNLDYYGGEEGLVKTIADSYNKQNEFFQEELKEEKFQKRFPQYFQDKERASRIMESGVVPPVIQKIDEKNRLIVTIDDYFGTASRIYGNKELEKIFAKLAGK